MAVLVSAKRWVRSAVNFPRYGPLGLDDPQPYIEVRLEGHGETRDVTRNNVVAALRPFTIGIMFESGGAPRPGGPIARLAMYEREGARRLLGAIQLRPMRTVELGEYSFGLFEVAGSENHCVPAMQLALYYLRERWRFERRQRKNPYNFRMTIPDLHASYGFYICPRPVVLVTVANEGAGNMFPMDLIGPTDSPWFSMALRSTSPAIDLMRKSRRMVLASVPFEYRQFAYELGKHHKEVSIDWASLPFATRLSPLFSLPVAVAALRVREVEVEQVHEVGSHILFLTRVLGDSGLMPGTGRQMFHTFQSYRAFRSMEEDDKIVRPPR
jgi:flavin reductase (DIM6/NTAB) family NADH-FMN oxidoreductase RutF